MGLPVNAVKEVDVEEYDSDGPAAELLEKVWEQPIVLLNKRLCCCLSFYNMRETVSSEIVLKPTLLLSFLICCDLMLINAAMGVISHI